MKRALLGFLFFVCFFIAPNGFANEETRFLMFLETPGAITRYIGPSDLVFAHNQMAIIQTRMDEIETWTNRVHESLGGCGGFIDVTEEIVSGQSPAVMLFKEEINRANYRVGQAHQVKYNRDIATLVSYANEEELWKFLTELSNFPDRSATSENGKKAAEHLKAHAEKLANQAPGFSTRFVETGMVYKQPSVVATLPGTDSSLPHVILGGHMDTFTNSKPGADDDGSGTSVVAETLRAVMQAEAHFRHTIDFIWYSAEERGLVGSSYVVKDFQAKKIPVKAVLQMDMVGYASKDDNDDIYLITDYTDAQLTADLRKIISTYTNAKIGETKCGYACSDHANWNRAGIPAVFPFEASFENMNHKLHTEDDKISHLDKAHSKRFVETALAFLGEVAELVELKSK